MGYIAIVVKDSEEKISWHFDAKGALANIVKFIKR